MADALHELLSTHDGSSTTRPPAVSTEASNFLGRLTSLSLESLLSTEPASLAYDADSLSRSLRALSKRSYRPVDTAVHSLRHLRTALPDLTTNVGLLNAALPTLEQDTVDFANKYGKSTESPILLRRKRAMLLGENMERLSDILELPSLLSSTIAASSVASAQSTASQASSLSASYASALDLHAHIKRLARLYPTSNLVQNINVQAEDAIKTMTANLVLGLRSQSLKLAGGMRLIGLLRRVAPDLDESQDSLGNWAAGTNEGSLGALFLVSRLENLGSTLDALEPLRELAEQETVKRYRDNDSNALHDTQSSGQQTERYLKRYIENFREQCFAIVSMYQGIFPASVSGSSVSSIGMNTSLKLAALSTRSQSTTSTHMTVDPIQKPPPALASFTFEVVDLLLSTLRKYLPNIEDRSSRDSLLTQVLYCAGSLGRLGGDFGLMLAELDDDLSPEHGQAQTDSEDGEWVQLTQKHRIQARRLELLASGVGSQRSASALSSEVHSAY